jgi:hypothetical protein
MLLTLCEGALEGSKGTDIRKHGSASDGADEGFYIWPRMGRYSKMVRIKAGEPPQRASATQLSENLKERTDYRSLYMA